MNTTLERVAQLFLHEGYVRCVCRHCAGCIMSVAEEAERCIKNEPEKRLKLLYSLSIAVETCPDLEGFILKYLRKFGTSEMIYDDGKQRKLLSEIIWRFVRHFGKQLDAFLPLDLMFKILHSCMENEGDCKWYLATCISELLSMSDEEKEKYFLSIFRERIKIVKMKERHLDEISERNRCLHLNSPSSLLVKLKMSSSEFEAFLRSFQERDVCHDNCVNVAGIELPRAQPLETKELSFTQDLVMVDSLVNNLRCLSLAVAAGRPVLLQGPVGSGKTSIVEYLASRTGRNKAPHFLKLQLGDQTDSKALLGTYRCTEIPGEFTWEAGVLTHAVREGHWLLLEDIDYAPLDVISVLLPLLERKSLSLPGHGDTVCAAPGFQLFATQRLLSSGSGWHRQQSSSSVLLEKMWTKINVEPLTESELKTVIDTKFPQLQTVTDKILDVYFMLSSGKHELVEDKGNNQSVGKFIFNEGRLISTRDLLSWCSRIAQDFDVSSTSTANVVFQEALDCFTSCIANVHRRLQVAEAIGAKVNVTKVMAEYFCCKYKPEIKSTPTTFSCGRVSLPCKKQDLFLANMSKGTFSYTRQAVSLLEKVAVCVCRQEPVLLVGETGTGKTTSVQYLAQQLGHKLHVINMNQQSDSSDLLGGFKPVDLKYVVRPFKEDFELLFCETFSRKENAKFLDHVQTCFSRNKWDNMLTLIEHTITPALRRMQKDKREQYKKWKEMKRRLQQLKVQIKQPESILAFSFIEGSLVKAIRHGHWVLLDEINLAAAETLECLSGLLESTAGSVVLTERGDLEPIRRHPDFRLFACMNPATDVGKKDLPIGIRNRFTEFYVDELEDTQDLKILVSDYLSSLSLTSSQVSGIVKFYLEAKQDAAKKLTDGTGHKPHFSLRTLCRALKYSSTNPCGLAARSLFEGFSLSFLTQLDRASHPLVRTKIEQHILGKNNVKSILRKELPMPTDGQYMNVEGYWVPKGKCKPSTEENYILTPSVRENLKDLTRIVSAGTHPVLLQGETSVGKTSLITYLARISGNTCVRVNNHEHTDLQEYVGSYSADQQGKLVFTEGVLVEAMRKGYWIILDELNLAPSDVLEALNRLLDDNRELFIPETQETVKAHPKFLLFATQNPPGLYGGRKMLSRAFRNRFVELHFDQIPSKELETILHERCSLPMSYSKRLVSTMKELQTRRRGSGVFAGKQGFMTLRDLFRWAERYKVDNPDISGKRFYDWDQHMADHGYLLLAGRVRKAEETQLVQEVIQKHFKRSVNAECLFTLNQNTSSTTMNVLKLILDSSQEEFNHIVWTFSMRRLAVLIGQCILYKEPVLLVGETGCGKTTVCQLYAALHNKLLRTVNCHLHTESADFLGGLRPCRSHVEGEGERRLFEWVDGPLVHAMKEGSMFLMDEISLADDSVLERLNSVLEPERSLVLAEKGGDEVQGHVEVITAADSFQIFATMNPGGDFGKKELSPALRNRFTEIWCPQTTERQDIISIIEHNLRDGIQLGNQEDGTSGIGRAMMDFLDWFSSTDLGKRCVVSIRDVLSWVHFINTCTAGESPTSRDNMDVDIGEDGIYLDPAVAFIHGACLVFLDGLGSGTTSRGKDAEVQVIRDQALKQLLLLVNNVTHHSYDLAMLGLVNKYSTDLEFLISSKEGQFGIFPFMVEKGDSLNTAVNFAFQAPTTCVNAQRVLRALQLKRPILLEGSPGVGKTSLVTAISKAAGHPLVRINLSEQTDVSDLFGADLPVEGEEGGVFAWRDGPLLQALKEGSWIVLDELNLASQSVLEGLNACFDHRSEVYIPELGRTFHIQHDKTRIFACQNPLNQGGGRKGLPKSFLNRFTQVYVEPLSFCDQMVIAKEMYPVIPESVLNGMVQFNMKVHQETTVEGHWGQRGSPWEFNLRDLFRWCELLLKYQGQRITSVLGKKGVLFCQDVANLNPGEFVSFLYQDRFRTLQDKSKAKILFKELFCEELHPYYDSSRHVSITNAYIQCGHAFVPINSSQFTSGDATHLQLLHHLLEPMESLITCIDMSWMALLVGPQSSGKTSLVQLLSQLTGNQLHVLAMNSAMDTTELLGGFEQADIGANIDGLRSLAGQLMSHLTKKLIIHGTLKEAILLQEQWQKCVFNEVDYEGLSSIEVLDKQKKMVTVLGHVIQTMLDIIPKRMPNEESIVCEIHKVKEKHMKLTATLQTCKPGCGGGAFEWIDSLLVKSLQEGHWILIDNVNFCNASVLDRLNALLEPDGSLSINERGVIDGQIPTIKPHPNFRLFMAMDPKYGEISRAMRNRGVEIYIAGEDDGNPYSSHDLLTLLNGIGLCDSHMCQWLLGVHKAVKSSVSGGEKPVLLDLLHAALLTKQQLDRGVTGSLSLIQATSDVYLKNIKITAIKKVVKAIIDEECLKLSGVENANPILPPVDVGEWNRNNELANIQHQSQVFVCCLHDFVEAVMSRNTDTMSACVHMCENSLVLILNLLPHHSWSLFFSWVHTVTKHMLKQLSTQQPEKDTSVVAENFQCMMKKIQQVADFCLHLVETNLQPLLEKIFSYSPQVKRLLIGRCVDLRWNLQVVEKLMLILGCQAESFNGLVTELNRYCALQAVSHVFFGEKDNLNALQQLCKDSRKNVHLLPEMKDLINLLTNNSLIMDSVQGLDFTEYKVVLQVVGVVDWWTRLLRCCYSALKDRTMDINMVSLYWNWFYAKAWVHIQESAPMTLKSIVKQVHVVLGIDESRVKCYIKTRSAIGYPKPFMNSLEADLSLRFMSVCKSLDVSCCGTQSEVDSLVSLLQCNTENVLVALHSCAPLLENSTDNQDVIEKILLQAEQCLQQFKTKNNTEANTSTIDVVPTKKIQTQYKELWPLFGHTYLVNEQFLLSLFYKRQDVPETDIQCAKDFHIQYLPFSSHALNIFIQKGQHDMNGHIMKLYIDFVEKMWNGYLPQKTILGDAEQQDPSCQKIMGPGSLYFGEVTRHIFGLLCGTNLAENNVQGSSRLHSLQVSLGDMESQKEKLQHISKHLWINSSLLSSPQLNARSLECMHFLSMFIYTMKCIVSAIDSVSDQINGILCQASELIAASRDGFIPLELQVTVRSVCSDLEKMFPQSPKMTQLCSNVCRLMEHSEPSFSIIGEAWVHLGLLMKDFLFPPMTVDLVEKTQIKLDVYQQELKSKEIELDVYRRHHQIHTGLDISLDGKHHPQIKLLMKSIVVLREKVEKLKNEKAFRPQKSQFTSLMDDIKHYTASVGADNNILALLKRLLSDQSQSEAVLKEETMWQKTQSSFITRLSTEYPLYQDVVIPCVFAVHQIKYGISLVANSVKVSLRQKSSTDIDTLHTMPTFQHHRQRLLINLASFPSVSPVFPSFLDLVKNLTSDLTLGLISALVTDQQSMVVPSLHKEKIILSRLFHACLDMTRNHCLVQKNLTSVATFNLSRLFHQFVRAWQLQEEQKREKEQREESIYRYKAKVHGDDRENDVIEEEEFQQNFPSYKQAFTDLTQPETLDEAFPLEADNDEVWENDQKESSENHTVTEDEMFHVYSVHKEVFVGLTSTDWYKHPEVRALTRKDVIGPSQAVYRLAAGLVLSSHVLGANMDHHFTGGHLLLSSCIQEEITPQDVSQNKRTEYDIYHDPNISEAVQCLPLLWKLRQRIQELQKEWPDHPTLRQLGQIIERIESFPVTSPVMKFLTGLELLLEKAQEWEKNAAKFVSLATELGEITLLIMQWRKLELGCWNLCLETVAKRHEKAASKWWFHLYNLIQAYITQDKRGAESTLQDIKTSLKEFIEKANLGDFIVRLDMLKAFHCQLVYMEPSESQGNLVSFFWNLYNFYAQFTCVVKDELERLSRPIHKELKGFVKIARWTDINYWALKDTTEKTHRTLHKHMKAYQALLCQPIQNLLSETNESLPSQAGEWQESYQSAMASYTFTYSQDIRNVTGAEGDNTHSLQRRLPTLCRKARKHLRLYATLKRYPDLITSIDEMTGEIKENVQELQSLNVTESADKEKQKSEAKHIHTKKRKALADLFKQLSYLGLSYRKGLILSNNTAEDTALDITPVNVAVLADHLQSLGCNVDPLLTALWTGCSYYFNKCQTRRARLLTALKAPSKELGVGNIERCKGFTEHLNQYLLKQYTDVAVLGSEYKSLMVCIKDLEVIEVNGEITSSPSECHIWIDDMKDTCIFVIEGLTQFTALLEACPVPAKDMETYPSPFPAKHLSQTAMCKRGDDLWQNILQTTQDMLSTAKAIQRKLDKCTSLFISASQNMLSLQECVTMFQNVQNGLKGICDMFALPTGETSCTLVQTVKYLYQTVSENIERFSSWKSGLASRKEGEVAEGKIEEFSDSVEGLIQSVLLVVQSLSKPKHEENSISVDSDTPDELIPEQYTVHLSDNLQKDCEIINKSQVVNKLKDILSKLMEMLNINTRSSSVCHCKSLILGCLPLLHLYSQLLTYNFIQRLALCRTSGKLLAVLLAIFVDLTTKGFCLPEEFADELAGEGAEDFVDIEGGGLGDGDGMKNVSDQIENEDQLDEAQKPGEKKEDNADRPDVKSEENAIEMSEDFEGNPQDLEDADRKEGSDDENDKDEEDDIDKQMGEVDDKDADKLDDQMWGSDNENEDDNEKEEKEETGPGSGREDESQLVAKDDNTGSEGENKNEDKKKNDQHKTPEEEEENVKPHEQEDMDQSEYDEDKIDPYHNKNKEQEEQPDLMDLPDDLNLDEEEDGADKNEGQDEPEDFKDPLNEETADFNKEENGEDKEQEVQDKEESMDTDAAENNDKDENDEDKGTEPQDDDNLQQDEDNTDSTPGFTAQDEDKDTSEDNKQENEEDDVEASETYGTKSHDAPGVEQTESAQDETTHQQENQQEETEGTGTASTEQQEGHEGQSSSNISQGQSDSLKNKPLKRKPGHSDVERSLGSTDQKYKKLKTVDNLKSNKQDEPGQDSQQSDLYEHVKDASQHDAQTIDAATDDQQQMACPNKEMEEDQAKDVDDVDMEQDEAEEEPHITEKVSEKLIQEKQKYDARGQSKMEDEPIMDEAKQEISGETIATHSVGRGVESSIHTELQFLHLDGRSELDMEKLRSELEEQIQVWSQTENSVQMEAEAAEAWHRYEALTSSLSQELCEQLRLVLEPTQATKLKGDYRTGKRLNMRKVITYIASQFRKDKIWLRRTKPSKRQYQVMLAIDDSSSMVDNHSKQMAYESLALIANALSLLESGELAIASFGADVRILHPFTEQFTTQAGAKLLQHFTFEQKKTKIAQLLKHMTAHLVDARSRQHGTLGNPDTSQLLLIVSDGRGLFMEGMETVKTAVRQAREANIFLVFVIIDNPQCKDSILDIRVPIFRDIGQMPEIQSYMDHFPFPFYIILRDINTLPIILSDALRQWFELVSSRDK